ncbi:MAG: YgiT-type zinc finger protein [Chloroflexota bacterium]
MSFCPICRMGKLQARSLVYIQWYEDDLLVVDRMPAQVCDICGERSYDYQAVESLQQLLWSSPPHTNRPPSTPSSLTSSGNLPNSRNLPGGRNS